MPSEGESMTRAKQGDTVRVHYTGKLDDGTIFDSSAGKAMLEFTIGKGQLIPGFEKAVAGMSPGESVTVDIPAAEAYGLRRSEMVAELNRSQLPKNIEVKIGQRLQMRQKSGQALVVKVTALSETKVTLDANHELAGKDLTFDIELVEIA